MFEHKRVAHGDLSADLLVHGIDVSLVDTHALLGKLWGIVDGDIMKLWVIAPVLICRKKQ